MARIYLIGFMGAGKSTVGRKLASLLGYKSLDLDDVFEKKYKINISHFFDKYNESLFRRLELKLLETTFEMDNIVISTGGGTPCFFDSIDKMNEHGITVYLKMPVDALVNRLQNAKKPRPLVKNKTTNSLNEFITRVLDERSSSYQKAHLKINAVDIDIEELGNKICKIMNDVV